MGRLKKSGLRHQLTSQKKLGKPNNRVNSFSSDGVNALKSGTYSMLHTNKIKQFQLQVNF